MGQIAIFEQFSRIFGVVGDFVLSKGEIGIPILRLL